MIYKNGIGLPCNLNIYIYLSSKHTIVLEIEFIIFLNNSKN